MENISTSAELKEAIRLLEEEKSAHFQEMRADLYLAYESLKPAKLIEKAMKNISSSPYIFNNVFNAAIGLLAGYLSKRALFVGGPNNKVGKLIGLILQFGVTNMVTYAPIAIKSLVQGMFSKSKNETKSN